jgi:hypothetical protein
MNGEAIRIAPSRAVPVASHVGYGSTIFPDILDL